MAKKKEPAPPKSRGLAATRLASASPPAKVERLAESIEEDGGSVLGAYKDPLGGSGLLLAGLPIDKVEPTPFQRDLSEAHTEKLATAIDKLGRFLDPVIAVRTEEGRGNAEAGDLERVAAFVPQREDPLGGLAALHGAEVERPGLHRERHVRRRDRARPVVDRLFVRNLENVQGDERDVILLSVGYGPREPGGTVHARFGPVSQEGGEKRLNVAITRARQQLRVWCSFDPATLDVSRTTHVGPKLLQLFLRFAADRAAREALLAEAAAVGEGCSLGSTSLRAPPRWGARGTARCRCSRRLSNPGHPRRSK